MLKKVSIPLQVIDAMLTLSPAECMSVLATIAEAAHADTGSPPFPERCAIWPDMAADITRQHRAAQSHARCGVRGGRPRREQATPIHAETVPDFDDGVTAFTASLEKPAASNAASYIVNSGFRMTPNYWDEFREFTEDSGLPDDLIIWACDKAAAKDAGWPYIKAILDRCITTGVTTLAQAVEESEKHAAAVKSEKEKQDTPKIKQVTAHNFPQREYNENELEKKYRDDFLRMAGLIE